MKANRLISILAAGALCAPALAACSPAPPAQPSNQAALDDGTTIEMWMRAGKETQMDVVIEAYNTSHKNQIKATYVPADQYLTKLSTAAASGSTPDLVATDLIFVPQLIEGGILADITAQVEQWPFADQLAPAHMANSTGDEGKIFGVPLLVDASAFLYNKTLFAEAGLNPDQPPASWDELVSAAKAVTALGDDTKGFWMGGNFPGGMSYNFTPLVWAQGADVVNSDGSFTLNSPELAKAIDLIKQLWDAGTMPATAKDDDGTGFFSAFQAGNIGIAATAIDGAVPYGGEDQGFEIGAFAVPGPAGGQASFTGGDVLSIPAASKHYAAALDFVNWIVSDQTQSDVYLARSYLPVRADLTSKLPADASEFLTLGASLVADGHTFNSLYYNEVIANPTGPYLKLIRDIVFNGSDPTQAMAEAQAAADAITSR